MTKNVLRKIEGATLQQQKLFRAAENKWLEDIRKVELEKNSMDRNHSLHIQVVFPEAGHMLEVISPSKGA